jgi:hypothetical protein
VVSILEKVMSEPFEFEMWACDARLSCVTEQHVDACAYSIAESTLLGDQEREALASVLRGRDLKLDKADAVLVCGKVARAVLLEASQLLDDSCSAASDASYVLVGDVQPPSSWTAKPRNKPIGVAMAPSFSAAFRASRCEDDVVADIKTRALLSVCAMLGEDVVFNDED